MQRVLVEKVALGLVALARDGEAAVGDDAVGVTSHDRAEVGGIRFIISKRS